MHVLEMCLWECLPSLVSQGVMMKDRVLLRSSQVYCMVPQAAPDTSHTACAGRARSPPRTSRIRLSPNSKLADAIVHYGLPRDIKAYLRTKASSINSPRDHMPGQAMTSRSGSTLGLNGIMSKQSATAQFSSRQHPLRAGKDCIAGSQLASLHGNCQ